MQDLLKIRKVIFGNEVALKGVNSANDEALLSIIGCMFCCCLKFWLDQSLKGKTRSLFELLYLLDAQPYSDNQWVLSYHMSIGLNPCESLADEYEFIQGLSCIFNIKVLVDDECNIRTINAKIANCMPMVDSTTGISDLIIGGANYKDIISKWNKKHANIDCKSLIMPTDEIAVLSKARLQKDLKSKVA